MTFEGFLALQLLKDISCSIIRADKADDAIARVCRAAIDGLGLKQVAVTLLEGDRPRLSAVIESPDEKTALFAGRRAGRTLIERAAREGKSLILADTSVDVRFTGCGPGLSFAAFPLTENGTVLGALAFIYRAGSAKIPFREACAVMEQAADILSSGIGVLHLHKSEKSDFYEENRRLRRLLSDPKGNEPVSDVAKHPIACEVMNFERRTLEDALRRHRGNQSAAGRELGVSPRMMNYRLHRLGIDPRVFRGA